MFIFKLFNRIIPSHIHDSNLNNDKSTIFQIEEDDDTVVISIVDTDPWTPDDDEIECYSAVRDLSYDLNFEMIRQHLVFYLQRIKTVPSYHEWISELNPENVTNGLVEKRFLLRSQPQLIMWNMMVVGNQVTPIN